MLIKDVTLDKITFSKILGKKDSFEIGRQLHKEGSKLGFFSNGWVIVC